jgi:ribosomal protein S18 acetylase RimI-like enzyme
MRRRAGIGRALVAHLLDAARQRGFAQVMVSTSPNWKDAVGLYEHCGFTEFRRTDVSVYLSLALKADVCE